MVTQTVRAPIKKVLATLKRTGQTLKQRREARTRGAGVDLVLADRIDQINPILWDELAQHASVFLSRSYLRVLEDFAPDNLQTRYALASQDGKALAIMLFQRVQVAGQRLRKPSAKGLRQQALKNLQENLLLCGNLLVWGSRSLAFAEGADTSQLWHAVGEALYRLRRADKLLGESDLAPQVRRAP
jgi:hypothetical protein